MKDEIRITAADVSALRSPDLFSAWMDRMPKDRVRKVFRLKREEDRLRSLGAGVLLHLALAEAGYPEADGRIRLGRSGKPFLDGDVPLFFSLSHSGVWAMCALSSGPVGCDIERTGRYRPGLAERFFTAEEREVLRPDEPGAKERFARLWTRKESLAKAAGCGLSWSFASVSAAGDTAVYEGIRYRLWDLEPPDGYAASAAAERTCSSAAPVLKIVSLADFLSPCLIKRSNFENFKSAVCHRVKEKGDIMFIHDTLEGGDIRSYYDRGWYPECFYLLAMLDYISRKNGVPLCDEFDDLRQYKLEKPAYPAGVRAISLAAGNDSALRTAEEQAIPEFKRFNIIENDVRNVV